jgi:hypothetical protein
METNFLLLCYLQHRAGEAASGESNIKDDLSEAIHLAHVNLLVGEWIAFGSNQIVALNERLGAMDRCQGGLFTSKIDTDPTATRESCRHIYTHTHIYMVIYMHGCK